MNTEDFWLDKPTLTNIFWPETKSMLWGRQTAAVYLWWRWWLVQDRISRCQHSVLVAVSPRVSPLASARTTQHRHSNWVCRFHLYFLLSRSRYYLWRYILVLLSVPGHPTSISLEPMQIYHKYILSKNPGQVAWFLILGQSRHTLIVLLPYAMLSRTTKVIKRVNEAVN